MNKAFEIKEKYASINEETCEGLQHSDILAAMVEYTELCMDIYRKPFRELKPLEDLWRAENSPEEFVIPGLTNLLKWVVSKFNSNVTIPQSGGTNITFDKNDIHSIEGFYDQRYPSIKTIIQRKSGGKIETFLPYEKVIGICGKL